MLFRTVYGPELEAVYRFIAQTESPKPRREIYTAFVPSVDTSSTQNIDDALSFLHSAYLIQEAETGWVANIILDKPFRLLVLRQLRKLELGQLELKHPLDCFYMSLISDLFIQPNHLLITELHRQANQLPIIAKTGGISREKLQAWQRVMAYWGLGYRLGNGFQCVYAPSLFQEILSLWHPAGSLQQFFEEHLAQYLPYRDQTGKVSVSVVASMFYLEQQDKIILSNRSDLPNKAYLGERKLKYISQQEIDNAI